jgi:hypothetical protein
MQLVFAHAILLAGAFKNGDVLTVGMDLANGILRFSRNGIHLGDAFTGVKGPLVAVVTQASEESKVTIQNRPTVLNMGEYTGELRCVKAAQTIAVLRRVGRHAHAADKLSIALFVCGSCNCRRLC